MRKESHFDVVIVGAGVTGWSAAYHLLRLGIKHLAVAAAPEIPASSSLAAGVVLGGQVDNFTRVSHAHGADFAADLWRFGDAAYAGLAAYCHTAKVPFIDRRRVRLITSEAELVEARRAVQELQGAGFAEVSLTELGEAAPPGKPQALAAALTSRVLAVQDDGPDGGWVDVAALLASLAGASPVPRLPAVTSLEPSGPQGVLIRLADGREVSAELVIVAAHLGIRTLVPELHDALVSIGDQWTEVTLTDRPAGALDLTGLAFSANHTYEWGVFTAPDRLNLGGGRYLRPLAGIEATAPSAEPKITAHLLGQLAKTFAGAGRPVAGATHAALDIRPCDELPVIGPMFGQGRLLIATGYMGAGLTQGFLAGRCLAELVQSGHSAALPRRLWPERLRSLES